MPNIPKKVIDRFTKTVPKFQKVFHIAKDRDVNESDTVAILQDVLAEVFGYDKYLEITREFAIRSTYCDLAIRVDDKVQFLVEAKAIGIDLKETHMRQAIDYGANHGIQWVMLTNGLQWRVYRIRFEQPVNYDLICSLDIFSVNPKNEKDQECLYLLSREGLAKNVRDEYYEKVQSVNRFIIGSLILSIWRTVFFDKKVPFTQIRYHRPPRQRYPLSGETAQWNWQKRYSRVSRFPSLKKSF